MGWVGRAVVAGHRHQLYRYGELHNKSHPLRSCSLQFRFIGTTLFLQQQSGKETVLTLHSSDLTDKSDNSVLPENSVALVDIRFWHCIHRSDLLGSLTWILVCCKRISLLNAKVEDTQNCDSTSNLPQIASPAERFSSMLPVMLQVQFRVLLSIPCGQGKNLLDGLVFVAGKILVECCQEVAARQQKPGSAVGYEDIGEAAYGGFGRNLVSTAMYTEIIGICSLLFVVEVIFRVLIIQHCHLCSVPVALDPQSSVIKVSKAWRTHDLQLLCIPAMRCLITSEEISLFKLSYPLGICGHTIHLL